MKEYEYIHRNKFISTGATTFDEIIESIESVLNFLKKLRLTDKVKYVGGAEDDYATFITTDEETAKEYGFEELDYDDEEDEEDEEEFEDEVLDFDDDENKDELVDKDEAADKKDKSN